MGELINKQDAIKYFSELWECIQNINDREEWEDVCVTTVNEIKSAQPRWTPCSEKTPNLSQEVLMSDEFDTVRVGSLEKYVDGDYYWEDSHGYLYDVEDWVAWMPLPKSYKLNRKNR